MQYWLNALNVKLGAPELLAFRLWSYLFLLGSIVAIGLLARQLCPDNPWALPAAMLFAAGSQQLIIAGRTAMLDSGQCFFLAAALLSFFHASKNRGWWLVCGAMVGLGALQKSPVAFVFIAILLFTLHKRGDDDYRWQHLRQQWQFNAGYYLALFLLLSWPLLQTVLDGSKYLRTGIQREMLARLSPLGDERFERGDFFLWLGWLWRDMRWPGLLALACVPAMLILKRWRDDRAVFSLAVVALVVMLDFSLATGTLYQRYLLVLVPLLVVLLVRAGSDLLRWKPAVFALAMVAAAASVPRMQAAIAAAGQPEDFAGFHQIKAAVERLDASRQPGDVVLIDSKMLPPGAYGYFGAGIEPYLTLKLTDEPDALRRGRRNIAGVAAPVLGITSAQKLALVAEIAGTYELLYRDADIAIWRRPAQSAAAK